MQKPISRGECNYCAYTRPLVPEVLADDTNQDRLRSFLTIFGAIREYAAEYDAQIEPLNFTYFVCFARFRSRYMSRKHVSILYLEIERGQRRAVNPKWKRQTRCILGFRQASSEADCESWPCSVFLLKTVSCFEWVEQPKHQKFLCVICSDAAEGKRSVTA